METLTTVLKHVGYFCLGAAFIFIFTGVTDTWMRRGLDAVFELLRFDIVNVFVLLIPFVPGGVFLMCSSALKARKESGYLRSVRITPRIH